ncbi:MAG: amidohydrolase [Gemmatimonadaceae bacterium]|nr:amidohydrolase [Gemmatimonadaceae bacterium]
MTPVRPMVPRRFAAVLLCAAAVSLTACIRIIANAGPRPALAVVNARIWTGVSAQPWAQALAVDTVGRITAVGTTAQVTRLSAVTVIDAKGQMVVPGFIDAHVHFVDGGFALASVQLRDAKSKAEFIGRIRDFARTLPKGAWITNGDWDHTNWGGDLPQRSWIDSVTPDNPVWINRLDGHMHLANSLALTAAHLTREATEVAGGEIVRDANGELTGVLKDNAQGRVFAVVPTPAPAIEDRALDAAMAYVASYGVTSVHNMGSWHDLAIFQRAHGTARQKTRIHAAIPLSDWTRLRDTVALRGRGDDWLRIGALKGFADGSLGSHTAAMFDGFTDKPADKGFFVTPPESLYARTLGADKAGLQVMVHAIGDRAIATQLDVFERVAKANGPRDRRFRIEHAQHIGPRDMGRFAKLGVIPSMQPYHAIDDGRWADQVIGAERASRTYAFRSLIDAKASPAFGSDWFVAPPRPLEGIYAAVTRRTLDDRMPNGWVPAQKITVEEALRAYTAGSAFAGFDEANRGTLSIGMLADFAVLERDITAIPPDQIRTVRVMRTVVGGRTVFERP